MQWPYDDALHAWWVEPGLVLAGEYPGTPDLTDPRLAGLGDALATEIRGQAATEKLELLLGAGIRTFVDLTTELDPLTPYREPLMQLAGQRGLDVRYQRCPIPDVGTIDTGGYRAILELIRTEAAAARPVYVHCWGGVGRTGTVVGCLLVERGTAPDEVPAKLVELRAGTRKADRRCPETEGQSAVSAGWDHPNA